MPELTAEEQKKKEEEEKLSSQSEEKVTSATSKSQQQDQLTDAQKLRVYEIQTKTVRDQGARLSAAEKELAELKTKAEEVAAPTLEESAKRFYADPVGTMKEAMAEMVAPLNKFKDRFESESEYAKIKRGFSSNPAFAKHLSNPQFVSVIDGIIAEGQKAGAEINTNNVEAAIIHTIGSIAVGAVVIDPIKPNGSEENKGEETKVETGNEAGFIPPYLAPGSPPQRKTSADKQYRELTENEARLARERGMTKEQYLDWLVVDPADVIDSKIGIPEKKGA